MGRLSLVGTRSPRPGSGDLGSGSGTLAPTQSVNPSPRERPRLSPYQFGLVAQLGLGTTH